MKEWGGDGGPLGRCGWVVAPRRLEKEEAEGCAMLWLEGEEAEGCAVL